MSEQSDVLKAFPKAHVVWVPHAYEVRSGDSPEIVLGSAYKTQWAWEEAARTVKLMMRRPS